MFFEQTSSAYLAFYHSLKTLF